MYAVKHQENHLKNCECLGGGGEMRQNIAGFHDKIF